MFLNMLFIDAPIIEVVPWCIHIMIYAIWLFHFFQKKIYRTYHFSGVTDTPVLDFWWCPLGFKASGQPYLHLVEAYMLHVWWNWPLVQHLPTSLWPTWESSQPLPHICRQTVSGLKTIYSQYETRQADALLTELYRLSLITFIQVGNG